MWERQRLGNHSRRERDVGPEFVRKANGAAAGEVSVSGIEMWGDEEDCS